MSSNPMQTGSPYNQQNNTNDSADTPFNQSRDSLSDRLTEIAVEEFGIDEHFIDFPKILVPQHAEDGSLYVEDLNNVLRYDLETGELRTTRDFEEAVEVVDHNQHAATTLEQIILG